MTISDQIRRLQNAKAAIKQALSNKGVIVSDTAKLDEYPALIDSIQAGGGDSYYGAYYEDLFYTRINRGGSSGESYSYLFASCNAKELNLSRLDTSNVSNMSYMFFNCNALTSLDLGNFDTSNVTTMNRMFYNCNKLTSIDLSNFDTSKVSDMGYMFSDCKSLTSLDLSNFDTGKVTTMISMFSGCAALETLDLSNWTVHGAYASRMLYNCNSLAKLKLCNCDEETISNIINSSDFPIGYINDETRKLYVDEHLIDIVPLLPEGWEYRMLYPLYEKGQFQNDRNLTVAETRVDSSHIDLSRMFSSCSSLESVDTEDWDTSNVKNMSNMFQNCRALVTLDLSSFNTSKVTNMSNMFDSCNALEALDLSNWDTSNVTLMSRMFGTKLRSLTTLRMLNCSFDTVNDIVSLCSTGTDCTLYINLSEEEAELLDLPSNWNYEII